MASTYFTVVTDSGTRKMLEALDRGEKLRLTEFAVGDGGGRYYTPEMDAKELKNEVWRGPINACYISEESENLLIVESVIQSDTGGFTIREMGIFDEDGTMIAICNTPDTQKVKVSDGVVHELDLSMEIALANMDNVELIVDPAVVMATKKDIEHLRIETKEQIEAINATTQEQIEVVAETKKDLEMLRVSMKEKIEAAYAKVADETYKQSTEYTKQEIANLVNGAPSTMDTLKEIADAMKENKDVVEALEAAIGSKANENEFESHCTNDNIHVTVTEKQQIQAHQNFIQDFISLFPGVADHKKATYQLGGGFDGGMIAPIYTAEEDCLVILNGFIQFLSPPANATIAGNLLINNTTVIATTLAGKETGINAPLAACLRLNKGDCVNVQLLCTGLSAEKGTMVNIHYFLKALLTGLEKHELT